MATQTPAKSEVKDEKPKAEPQAKAGTEAPPVFVPDVASGKK